MFVKAAAVDVPSAVQQYTQDINTMALYVQAILSNQLPDLSGFTILDPGAYNNFTQSFSNMEQNASNWQSEVQPNLSALVGTLASNSNLAMDQLGTAISVAQRLQADPEDSASLQAFNDCLSQFLLNIKQLDAYIEQTLEQVQGNPEILTSSSDLGQITESLADMLSAAAADISSIDEAISSINSQIQDLNGDVKIEEILAIGSAVMMLVGFGLTLSGDPEGVDMIFDGVIDISEDAAQIELDEEVIAALQAQVNALQTSLTNDTAAYAVARTASTLCSNLSNQLGQILQDGSPMQQIQSFVGAVLSDLQEIQQGVQQAAGDEGNWASVISDLQGVENEWGKIQSFVGNAQDYTITPTSKAVIIRSST